MTEDYTCHHASPRWFPVSFSFGRDDARATFRGVIDEQGGAYGAEMRNTRFDSRFVPSGSGSRTPWYFIVCLIEGDLSVGSRSVSLGEVFVVPDKSLTAAGNKWQVVRSRSQNLRAALIRVRSDELREKATGVDSFRPCSSTSFEAFDGLAAALAKSEFTRAATGVKPLIRGLEADGILSPRQNAHRRVSTRSETFTQRLAAHVFPLLSELVSRPMLVDAVARAGVSERQFLRTMLRVQERFDLLDRGWRPSMVRWRATAAALLCSYPQLTFEEVADLAGYSSTSAMHRGLRAFGLPTPGTIRDRTNNDA